MVSQARSRPVLDGHRGCAAISRGVGEPVIGTAGRTSCWLLIEMGPPWGDNPVTGPSLLPPEARAAVLTAAQQLPLKVLAIRQDRRWGARRYFLAHSGPDEPWLREGELHELEPVLARLDWHAIVHAGVAPAVGVESAEPLFVVCTHGKRDACCAEHGRPLVRALEVEHPRRTWQCSHLGGDRFAANMACLPEGVMYGHVPPRRGPEIAAAHQCGRVVLDHLRGRTTQSPDAQAAEWFLRRETGVHTLDGVRLLQLDVDDGIATAHLVAAGSHYHVRVTRRDLGALISSGCAGTELSDKGRYELLGIRRHSRSPR